MSLKLVSKVSSILFILCVSLLLPSDLYALDQQIKCKKNPRLRNLFRNALVAKVAAAVDQNLYDKPKVKVKLKVVNVKTNPGIFGHNELSQNINLVSQQTPSGLAYGLSGYLDFSDICEYEVLATVTSRARSKSTGKIIKAITQSTITIYGPMDGNYKKLK